VLTSNFNGTPIQAGTSIWFNSVLKVSGLGASPVTLNVVNGTIDFTANGSAYHVNVPNASITFSPTATTATTRFDVPTNTWITNVPSNLGGNVFLAGVVLPVVTKLPGGINPVTWQATFQSSAAISVNWQWAAAVYNTSFSSDYNTLGVKPVDDNQASQYKNSDHAGTPENYTIPGILPGGARGGGGSNWTGSYSGTAHVTPTVVTATSSLSGVVFDDTADNNGIQEAGESGLSGVTVTLTGTDLFGNKVSLTTTTDSNGFYHFTGLVAGTYTITETPPANYMSGLVSVGSQGGSAGNGQVFNIVLNPGASGTGYNFAELFTATSS
jgi:hypothetical protein